MLRRKNHWVFCLFFIFAILENSIALSTEIEKGPTWKLSMALPESNRVNAIQLSPTEHFHVVLENISKHSQRIWKNSNSWGYSALYFEMTDETGRKQIVRKQPRDWRKNAPHYWSIKPGQYLVYNISLTGKDWKFALPNSSEGRRLKIQAVLDIPDEGQARELGVWTGLVKSVVNEIDVWE